MKLVVLLALVALVFSQNLASESGACAVRAKLFYNQLKSEHMARQKCTKENTLIIYFDLKTAFSVL